MFACKYLHGSIVFHFQYNGLSKVIWDYSMKLQWEINFKLIVLRREYYIKHSIHKTATGFYLFPMVNIICLYENPI